MSTHYSGAVDLLPAVKTGGLAAGFTFGGHNPPDDHPGVPAVQ